MSSLVVRNVHQRSQLQNFINDNKHNQLQFNLFLYYLNLLLYHNLLNCYRNQQTWMMHLRRTQQKRLVMKQC